MLMHARESIYSPTQEGLIFPQEPVFASSADERRYRKEHLAAACRIFARGGFSFGFGGHRIARPIVFRNLSLRSSRAFVCATRRALRWRVARAGPRALAKRNGR